MKTIDILTFGGEGVKCVRVFDHNKAMLMLAKLRDRSYYPKGGYSSDVTAEWDALLDEWFGEVRPDFTPNAGVSGAARKD